MTECPPSKQNLWGQRGSIALPRLRKGEDGRYLCRWCWGAVPAPRRLWCSPACVHDYRQRSDWSYIRDRIIERDKVCACCGGCRYSCKGGARRAPIGWGVRESYWHTRELRRAANDGSVWGPFNVIEARWEVDHILAVADGGTDDPSNLRLLCVPCHHERTAFWHTSRAAGASLQLELPG